MKSSKEFKKIIQDKLQEIATGDELFAQSLKKENKNINDCINYILNSVKKSGICAFSDDEIFGMAMHYYDEDDVKGGKSVMCKIVTNHSVELSEEEKQQAKQAAIDQEIAEQRTKLHQKRKKKESNPSLIQQSLF